MNTIAFQSHVTKPQRGHLERLMFFNVCQQRVTDCIANAVERFGTPEIFEEDGRLRIRVNGRDDVQCLFATEADTGRPVGVAIYLRSEVEQITVLHVSIASEYAKGGVKSKEWLLLRLLRELRRSTRRAEGVQRMELLYLTGRAHTPRFLGAKNSI